MDITHIVITGMAATLITAVKDNTAAGVVPCGAAVPVATEIITATATTRTADMVLACTDIGHMECIGTAARNETMPDVAITSTADRRQVGIAMGGMSATIEPTGIRRPQAVGSSPRPKEAISKGRVMRPMSNWMDA